MSRPARGFGTTDALLLLTTLIWGINYTSVKYAGLQLSALTFTWLRVLLAMATLLLVAVAQRQPWPPARDVIALLGLGVLGNGIYQLLFVGGVARTRVADAALLAAILPALVALLAFVRGVEKIHLAAGAGIALSILGAAVVVLGSTQIDAGNGTLLGIAMVLAAVLCWGAFTVGLRPYTLRVDTVQINALTMAGGMIPLVFFTPAALRGTAWGALPPMVWVAVAFSSVISMGLAYLFWFRGVRELGPTRTAVYANLQPVAAILFAWVALHEVPTAWQGLGAAMIIAGILMTRTHRVPDTA